MTNQKGFTPFIALVLAGFLVSVITFVAIVMKKGQSSETFVNQQVNATPREEIASTAVEGGSLVTELGKIKVDNVDGDFQDVDNDLKSLAN